MSEFNEEQEQPKIETVDNETVNTYDMNLKERISWALTKPSNVIKKPDISIAQQKKELQEKEKNGEMI